MFQVENKLSGRGCLRNCTVNQILVFFEQIFIKDRKGILKYCQQNSEIGHSDVRVDLRLSYCLVRPYNGPHLIAIFKNYRFYDLTLGLQSDYSQSLFTSSSQGLNLPTQGVCRLRPRSQIAKPKTYSS